MNRTSPSNVAPRPIRERPASAGRHALAASLLLAATLAMTCATARAEPLRVVSEVDLARYVGKWHEIARYPNVFEKMCARDVTAEYARNADGTIAVVNACRKEDGTIQRAEGLARVVAPAKLEVRFAPAWLGFLPFVWGDYWVIDLAADYSYAVVGDPAREYLWILAREPRMDDATWDRVVGGLPALGYDASKLLRNPPPAR
jgi:apolipoprotein D and lipocalin family protein